MKNSVSPKFPSTRSPSVKQAVCAALAVWSFSLAATCAAAGVPAHTGTTNPIAEGFTVLSCCGSATAGPVNNDLGQATWSISASSTASQFGYQSGALTADQKNGILADGFSMSFTARAVRSLAPAYEPLNHVILLAVYLDNGVRRFDVDIGINAQGDTVVVLPTSIDAHGPGASIRAPGQSFTLVGSGSTYHDYVLNYNPTTQLASLSVDGNQELTGYAGHTSFVENRGLVWAAVSGGIGNFANVSVSLVPEPSTTAMSLAGLLSVLAVVSRCHSKRADA